MVGPPPRSPPFPSLSLFGSLPNESWATTAAAVTLTSWLTVFVAPLSSVTVSLTVYVPAEAYVWFTVTPVPAALVSPKSHEYVANVPSGSLDPDPSNPAFRSTDEDVNAATGDWFAADTLTSWLTVFV